MDKQKQSTISARHVTLDPRVAIREPVDAKASLSSQILGLLHYGLLAPSGHNSQPWALAFNAVSSPDVAAQSPAAPHAAGSAEAPVPPHAQGADVQEPQVDILLDLKRRLAVVDPDMRESRISCGALLFNLEVGARACINACSDRAVLMHTAPPIVGCVCSARFVLFAIKPGDC